MKFREVVKASNFGSWDELDCVALRAGEWVEVRYPNGETIIGPVRVDSREWTFGNNERAEDSSTYIDVVINGAAAKLPLLGLEASRVTGDDD